MTATNPKTRRRTRSQSRDAALRKLGFRDYKHYLESPEWRSVRVRHRDIHGERCGLCDTDEGTRHLHHMTYERVGQEELSDLVLLCANCHQLVHVLEERGEIGLDFQGLASYQRAVRYTAEGKDRMERMSVLPDNAGDAKQAAAALRAKREKALVTVRKRKAEGKPCPGWAKERLEKIEAELAQVEAGLESYAF